LRTHVEFRSEQFPPYPGEEEEINPGLWGRRLAEYLREKLLAQNVEAGEPFAEDWGYVVPLPNRPFKMWLGCGHQSGEDDSFLIFIEPSRPSIRVGVFKKIDTRQEVARIAEVVDAVLKGDPHIHNVTWIEDQA
jgi:hypothetical protein